MGLGYDVKLCFYKSCTKCKITVHLANFILTLSLEDILFYTVYEIA
jgi:hypothetical protein